MLTSALNVGSAGTEAENSLNMSFLLYMVVYTLVVTKSYQLVCHPSLTLVGMHSAQHYLWGRIVSSDINKEDPANHQKFWATFTDHGNTHALLVIKELPSWPCQKWCNKAADGCCMNSRENAGKTSAMVWPLSMSRIPHHCLYHLQL